MTIKHLDHIASNTLPSFREVFNNMDKFWNSFYFSPSERLVPMDVIEGESGYEMQIAIPGASKEDIKVDIKQGSLTIEAVRPKVENDSIKYLYKGLSAFEFRRTFSDLDTNLKVDTDKITSVYKDGLLTVTLPKKLEALPRVIPVEVK
tara:strand:+ start:412 stop:855 length:444 start_codon:yes stop_codon:yes gene_type:complete